MSLPSLRRTILRLVFLPALLFLLSCEKRPEVPLQPAASELRTEVAVSAVGDVMMPISIQRFAAKNKYNYDLLFEKIAADLGAADITFANLETPVVHTAKISGYPRFNARPELLAALKRTGIDIVSLANNHVMDQGVSGLKRTIDHVAAAGLAFTGAGRTKKEAGEAKYSTVKGVTCAFLAYTYSTNERLPGRKATAPGVNVLRTNSKTDLAGAVENVKEARKAADLVIVSLHWGDEYATQPAPWQKQAAKELIEAGADIILGHHPHVLQPIETIAATDGRKAVVAFSLGNFISSQNYGISFKNRDHKRALRGDGIIFSVTAVKESGKTAIKKAEFLPIWTLREKIGKTVVPRPVNLAREIARLQSLPTRSREEENLLMLLSHRRNIITEKLGPPPASNIP